MHAKPKGTVLLLGIIEFYNRDLARMDADLQRRAITPEQHRQAQQAAKQKMLLDLGPDYIKASQKPEDPTLESLGPVAPSPGR